MLKSFRWKMLADFLSDKNSWNPSTWGKFSLRKTLNVSPPIVVFSELQNYKILVNKYGITLTHNYVNIIIELQILHNFLINNAHNDCVAKNMT